MKIAERLRACVNAAPSNGNVVLTWQTADRLAKALADMDAEQENTRTLDPSIESLQAHCAEAEMRAHQWMKAHDKLKAGKPYDLPKPADLPEAIESLRAEVKALRTLVRNYVDPFDVTPADHAMVLALGTDDEEGYREALASKGTDNDR